MKKYLLLLATISLLSICAPSAQAQVSCAKGVTVSDGTCIVQGSAAAPASSVPNAAPVTCPGGGKLLANGACNLGYTQLEPIPGLTQFDSNSLVQPNNLHTIIDAIFKILITAGALIAVLSLTLGGVQYMVSGSAGGKNAGRKRAEAALWGIVLIAASWLILNTINPALLNFSLNPCSNVSTGCIVTAGSSVNTSAPQTIQLTAAQIQQISQAQGYSFYTPVGNAVLFNNSDASSDQVGQQVKQLQTDCGSGVIKSYTGTVVGGASNQTVMTCNQVVGTSYAR